MANKKYLGKKVVKNIAEDAVNKYKGPIRQTANGRVYPSEDYLNAVRDSASEHIRFHHVYVFPDEAMSSMEQANDPTDSNDDFTGEDLAGKNSDIVLERGKDYKVVKEQNQRDESKSLVVRPEKENL